MNLHFLGLLKGEKIGRVVVRGRRERQKKETEGKREQDKERRGEKGREGEKEVERGGREGK